MSCDSKKSCRQQLPYLFFGAVFTALTLIFPQFGILEWITMIPLVVGAFRLCENPACTLKRAYGYGFLTVYVFYFVIYHWFVNLYPLDFVGMDNVSSAIVIAAGWLGLPLLQAAVGGLIFLIFRGLHKTGLFDRIPFLRPFVFASLWVVFEWSSTLGWTGVPWGRLALGQIEMLPFLQSASLFGSYFVTWLLVAVNALLAYAILYQLRSALCGTVAAALFFSNLFYGVAVCYLPQSSSGEQLTVAVIQGNINSHEKWSADSYALTTEIYGTYTKQAAEEGAELIIWPESTFPYDLNLNDSIKLYVSDLAIECDATLIVGALYYDETDGKEYNALYCVESDGTICEDFYAKRHLVPFGEYVPMRDVIMTLIPPLANLSALDSDLNAGTDSALLETKWGSVGALICFDSIYEQLTIDSARDGAELLIVSSNDSWFFDSAAVYQHQAQAQLRAIESGKYLARSGNTGISSIVSPKGEILEWIDPLVDGYAVSEVTMRTGNTLYTVIGNLFVYLCALFVAALLPIGLLLPQKRGLKKFNSFRKEKSNEGKMDM